MPRQGERATAHAVAVEEPCLVKSVDTGVPHTTGYLSTTRAVAGAASIIMPASRSQPTASLSPSAAFSPLKPASPRGGSRHLRYPKASSRAAPVRPERHVPHSIASIRRRLTVGLVHLLPRCPCCLQKQRTPVRRL